MVRVSRVYPVADPGEVHYNLSHPFMPSTNRNAFAGEHHKFTSDHRVWEKDVGQGPVTEADLEVDAMLHTRQTGARPDYGWLSEASEDNASRLACARVFVVEPAFELI